MQTGGGKRESLEGLRANIAARLDKPIFQSGDVIITPSVAKFGKKTYSMVNIDSVSVARLRDPVEGCLNAIFLIAAIGIILALLGATVLLVVKNPLQAMVTLSPAVACSVALYLMRREKVYVVCLQTSSGDMQVLKSKDEKLVNAVKDAIEHAFVLRG